MDKAVGLSTSVHEGPHVGERLLQIGGVGLGIRCGLIDTVSPGGNVRLTRGGIQSSHSSRPPNRSPGQHQDNEEHIGACLDVDLGDGLVEDHRIGVVPSAAVNGGRQGRGGSDQRRSGLRPRKLVRALRALRRLLLATRLVGLIGGDLMQMCPQRIRQ